MKRTAHTVGYVTGLHRVTPGASAWLQPDGHFGLNNAGVFWTGAGAVLVDCAYDVPRARKIAQAIDASGAAQPQIAALVLTHDHGDHSFGACAIPTGRVVMTDKAAAALRQAAGTVAVHISGLQGDARAMMETLLADKFDFSEVRYRPPTETFSGATTLAIGGVTLHLREFEGVHTVSDTIVHCPQEGVVVMGDLMFADSHIPFFRPSSKRWAEAMTQALALDAEHYVPGHGRLCTRDDVREHRDYLWWIYDQAERRCRKGMTPEEAADDLVQKLGDYAHLQRADNLVTSLDVLYREVDPKRPETSYSDSLAMRWRFRMKWRGRLPGVVDALPLNTRLGGFKTLAALRMLEGT